MDGEPDLDDIDDEERLKEMLEKSDNLDYRRRIRSRLRAINKAKPASEIVGSDAKLVAKQHQPPARVHQPKETRAAAVLITPKKSNEVDGRRAANQQSRPASTANASRNEHQSVMLRTVEQKPGKPREATKSEFVESVTLRKVGDVKPADSGTPTSKAEFLERKTLRKVDDVKSPSEPYRKSTGQQKSDFLETVTLRKVEAMKVSGSKSESSAVRSTARSLTPKMAMEHFKGIDATTGSTSGDGQKRRSLSPNNIRQAMLDWCRYRVYEYKNVDIVDFSSSWSNGMAFCALVHSFFPDAFDFDELNPTDRRHNFQLAFTTAEQRGDVMPLLDVDDMLQAGSEPDWKCVFTYVNSIYAELQKKKSSDDQLTTETSAAAEVDAEDADNEVVLHIDEDENDVQIILTAQDDD